MLLFFLLSSLLSASFAVPSDTTIDNFKTANAIVLAEKLDLQEFRGGGILTTSAGFIDIDSASPYSVSTAGSANGRLSRGFTSSGHPFLVVRDTSFTIVRIVVRLADGSLTTFRRVDDSFFAEVSQEVSRTVEYKFTGNDSKEIPRRLRNLRKVKQQINRELQSACSSFYEIEVAIGYDSTFCDDYDNQAEAETTIENIVAQASLHYEQPGLCTQISIVDLEGYCNSNADPYFDLFENGTGASGCSNDGMLDDFANYWEANKSGVRRDVAHLFQGRAFTDGGVAGCAYVGALCYPTYAYGVNRFSWTSDETWMSTLFAHELGHNSGANHDVADDSVQYVMEPSVNSASDGFSTVSMNSMSEFLSGASCIGQVSAPTPPETTPPEVTPPEPETPAPSSTPTSAPTGAPSSAPTPAPSATPTTAPSPAPSPGPTAVSTEVQDATPQPTPSPSEATASPTDGADDEINGSAFVRIYFRPLREDPGEEATNEFVNDVGEMVCRHLSRSLRRYFRGETISITACTYTPEPGSSLTSSPFAMLFEFTVRFEDSQSRVSAVNKQLDVDDAVEQAFIGSAEEELVEEMQTLPDSNPLAESSGVTLENMPPSEETDEVCIMLPDFFLAIPILGNLLNALLCTIFGGFL